MQATRSGFFLLFAAAVLFPGFGETAPSPPLTVVLVLDTSGSIRNQDLTRVRNLAPDLLSNLPPSSEIAVFGFDDEERLLVPRTADVAGLERSLASLSVGGSRTVLNDALYAAGNYLHEQPGGRKALVLISDGKDTGSALLLDEALKFAREAHFPVFTVSVEKSDVKMLRRIALLTEGRSMTLEEVSGYALAQSLAAALPPPVVEAPVPEPLEDPSAEPSRESATPSEPSGSVVYAGAAAAAALLAGGAGVLVVAVRRRRRAPPVCPGCGSPLSTEGACAQCTQVIQPQPQTPVPPPVPDNQPVPDPLEVRPGPTLRVDRSTLGTLRVRRGRLVIENGQGAGNVFDVGLGSTVLVGRSHEAQVQLADMSISQRHCQLRADVEGFYLQDLGSLNGTFVNGKASTAEHSLKDGDMIQLGETTLRFRLG